MIPTAKDLLTGETFTPTRSDQKFATRENQIRYNNLKAKRKRQAKAKIDRTLDNNRNILTNILKNQEQTSKSYQYLLGAGFDFGISTHKIKIENTLWSCIYEYAIRSLEDNQVLIKKMEVEQ